MKTLFSFLLKIMFVLAVVGISTPGYAKNFPKCFKKWESTVLKKCQKEKQEKQEKCLKKAEKALYKCAKSSKEIAKNERKGFVKCLDKDAMVNRFWKRLRFGIPEAAAAFKDRALGYCYEFYLERSK